MGMRSWMACNKPSLSPKTLSGKVLHNGRRSSYNGSEMDLYFFNNYRDIIGGGQGNAAGRLLRLCDRTQSIPIQISDIVGVNSYNHSTISRRVFALSARELGYNASNLGNPQDGTAIPYFNSNESRKAKDPKGSLHHYLTRTPCRASNGRIIRAAGDGNAALWTHGQQCSPLQVWDGEELKKYNATYVCISQWHYTEALQKGFEAQSILIDIPVPFEAREVAPAGGRCVAVGNLAERKCYDDIAAIAELLQKKTDVYGEVQDAAALEVVNASPWLEYRGRLPHDQLLDAIKGADFMIHAARVEGFPVSVREANGMGIPVITWDIPLYRDNGVDPAKNILQPFRGNIAAALAAADMKALRSIKNRRALAAQTHEQYGPAAFAEKLSALLKEE